MVCRLDIKRSLIDNISKLTTTSSASKINEAFGEEVVKPNGRIFVSSKLVDKYYKAYQDKLYSISASEIAEDDFDFSDENTYSYRNDASSKFSKRIGYEKNSLNQEKSRLYEALNRIPFSNTKERADIYKRIEDVENRLEMLEATNTEVKQFIAPDITEPDVYIAKLKELVAADFLRLEALLNPNVKDLAVKLRNIEEAQRIINFYNEIGDFSAKSNFLFPDTSAIPEYEKKLWQEFRDTADSYQNRLTTIHRDVIVTYTKQMPSVQEWLKLNKIQDITYDFLIQPVKDKDWLSMQTLSLPDSFMTEQVLVLDVLYYLIKEYENKGIKQRRDVITNIDILLDKIEGKHNNFKEFMQMDGDVFTGRIIFPYSQKYFDTRASEKDKNIKLVEKLRSEINKLDTNAPDYEARKKILDNQIYNVKKWIIENSIMVDFSLLPEIYAKYSNHAGFDYQSTPEERTAYKNYIIKHLGVKGYEESIERINNKLTEYFNMYEYYEEMGKEDLQELVNQLGISNKFEEYLRGSGYKLTLDDAMNIWKHINSPFNFVKNFYKNYPEKLQIGTGTFDMNSISFIKGRQYQYTEEIPRRYKGKIELVDKTYRVIESNEETGFYDKNFAKIENDQDLYNFWKFAIRNLALAKKMIPYKYQSQYMTNSILYMEKTFLENMNQKGLLSSAYSGAYDAFIASLTDKELSKNSFETNPFADNLRNVNYNFLGTRREMEKKLLDAKLIKYFIDNKYNLTPENYKDKLSEFDIKTKNKIVDDINKMKKEVVKEVAEKASFDLGSILKFQIGSIVALNQRDNILPLLQAYERTLGEIKKAQTNRAGEVLLRDDDTVKMSDLPVERIVKQAAYTIDIFTGQPVQEVEGVSDKKLYTQEEKIEMANLEKMKENATEEQRNFIKALQEKYGSQVTLSGTADTALSYLRIKSLGWNAPVQIPNAAAGYFSNFNIAADGRIVKMSAMRRAYNLFFHITFPSFLRGKVNTEQLNKIKTLMYRGDFLLDATSEMQKSRLSYGGRNSKLNTLINPYTSSRMVEYMNQGTLVAARLMSIKVTKNDGTVSNLFDALDENLNIKPEYSNIENEWNWETGTSMEREMMTIRKLVEDTHGDYSETGRQYAKRKIAGRMAMFFKTWLPNALKVRFGAYKSGDLYYGLATKGRYRSYTPATAALAGAALGTWLVPGVGSLVGYGIGFGVAKIWGNDVNDSVAGDVKDSFKALGYLLQRMLFTKLSMINSKYADVLDKQFEGQFDELDAANLRANLQEIQAVLTMILVYFIAKAILFDDDEEKKNQLVHNFIINQIVKIQTDLLFYTSPQTPGNLVEGLIPVSNLVDQSFTLIVSAHKLIFQYELEPNEDTFGENVLELFPKVIPSKKMLERTYNEPKILKDMFEEE